ncbi:hypothetical protein OAU51_01755 [Porticoccaceae bacterium]|jgi:hypothetical protein|nr:hypothetical protein [Porticoccaceae bacterium]
MQPSQQAYYLQTLGIVQYVPKDSVLVVKDAPAAFNDLSLDSDPAPAPALAAEERKNVDVAARINLNFDKPAASEKVTPPASPAKSVVPRVAATVRETPAALIEVKFSLWQPNSEVLVCSAVEGPLADTNEMQLLTNILNAVGCGIHRLPQMELVEWPPYPNADGDENEVREFLATLLQARLNARPVKYILLLGESAAEWLLSRQQRSEQPNFGQLALSQETAALIVPALSSMIDSPELKSTAWQLLKSVSFAPETA